MSKALLNAVWECDLPRPEKAVLSALAYNGNDSGRNIWPSIQTVCGRTGYRARQVHNIIARLKQRGVLVAEGRKGRTRGFVTIYRMDLSSVPKLTSASPESLQSEAESLQSEHESLQFPHSKSAIASAEEQQLNRIEQKRIVRGFSRDFGSFPEVDIEKRRDELQAQAKFLLARDARRKQLNIPTS